MGDTKHFPDIGVTMAWESLKGGAATRHPYAVGLAIRDDRDADDVLKATTIAVGRMDAIGRGTWLRGTLVEEEVSALQELLQMLEDYALVMPLDTDVRKGSVAWVLQSFSIPIPEKRFAPYLALVLLPILVAGRTTALLKKKKENSTVDITQR